LFVYVSLPLQNVLVHSLIPYRLQIFPVEGTLAGARRPTKQHNVLVVRLFFERDVITVVAKWVLLEVKASRETPRLLSQEELLRRLEPDADIVGEIPIRTAEVLGRGDGGLPA